MIILDSEAMKTIQESSTAHGRRRFLRSDFLKFDPNRANLRANPKCTGNNHVCGKICLPPDKVCRVSQQEVQEIVDDIEDQIRTKPIEYLAVVDSSNGELIGSNTGGPTSCRFTRDMVNKMMERPPGTCIITHNHPNSTNAKPDEPLWNGVSFSDADLMAASFLRAKEVRAVSNGYNHSIKPKNDDGRWPERAQLYNSYQKHTVDTYYELWDEINTGKISIDQANADYAHRIVSKVAKDYDLKYKRTPVRKAKSQPKSRKDSVHIDSEKLQRTVAKRGLEKQSRSILQKIYKGSQIIRVAIDDPKENGLVYGLFWDKDSNKFTFSIGPSDQVLYKLAGSGNEDSISYVIDRRTGSKQPGVRCGDGWISADKVCRKVGGDVPKAEIQQLRSAALMFNQKHPQMPTNLKAPDEGDIKDELTPAEKVDKEELSKKSIRSLRDVAREAGVVGYGSMTKAQLVEAIAAAKEDPEQQARIRKTLERKRQARKEARSVPAAKALADWNKLQRILAIAGVSPAVVMLASAAFVGNKTRSEIKKSQQKYQNTLGDAARNAESRAKGMQAEAIEKDNMLFVVGGFKGEGSSAEKLEQSLRNGDSEQDKWFAENNHFIQHDLQDMDVPEYKGRRKKDNGENTPEYNAHLAFNGMRNFIDNYSRGHSEDAVELAAKIFAYANHEEQIPGKDKPKKVNQQKRINILAHSAGGSVVNEALDILKEMKMSGSPGGESILKRVNVVNLGTPSFGYSEDLSRGRTIGSQRTIVPKRDWISKIGPRNPTTDARVKGRDVEDFMGQESVRRVLRESFGFFK